MVSTFGKIADTGENVCFVVDSNHPNDRLIKNVVHSQSYVSEYALDDYPITDADILHRGEDAWNAALHTVNSTRLVMCPPSPQTDQTWTDVTEQARATRATRGRRRAGRGIPGGRRP